MLQWMKKQKTFDVHGKVWGMEWHCWTCNKSFKSAKAMMAHLRRKHKEK